MDRSSEDLREVDNYVIALKYGLEGLDTLPISLRLVRELHERLMRGVRGDVAAPPVSSGAVRTGSDTCMYPQQSTYVPPPQTELMSCLDAWERFLHDESVPPLIHAALVHSQFEAIHPFLDGNGRVGRLLITLQLVSRDIIPSPLLYLCAYFEATRDEYYARLLGVTDRGGWKEWLTYFLRRVVMQAEDAVDRIQRTDDLFARWRHELATGRSRFPERVLDLFVENSFWTVRSAAYRLDVAYTTAQRAVDRLESLGIVSRVGEARRNRVYCAFEVLAILEEPPSLH